MTNDRDIDELLRVEGARWRQAVPLDRDVQLPVFNRRSGWSGWRRGIVGVGTVGALAVVLAVALGAPWSPAVGPSGSAAASSQEPASTESAATPVAIPQDLRIVSVGQAVVASGTLGEQDGKVYLCPTTLAARMPSRGGAIGCVGTNLVLVHNAQSWRGDVRVEGVWDGEAIEAIEIERDERPTEPSWPPIPCGPPVGGWPGLSTTDQGEAASLELQEEVDRQPERYLGLWSAAALDAAGEVTNRALVVGTVDDVESVTAELTAIYPYNLCVVRTDFSAADLQPVSEELEALDYPLHVQLEPRAGRVIVWTTALSPEMADVLGRYSDAIELHTTLRRSTDPETIRSAIVMAVNLDTDNFDVPYLQRDGVLVIRYVGENAGRAAIEPLLSPGVPVRWEQVDYSRSELKQIHDEIFELVQQGALKGVVSIASGSSRNQVEVTVGPDGSVSEVAQLLAKYGDAVRVEAGEVIVTQPGLLTPNP